MGAEGGDDGRDIAVCPGVVVPEEPYHVGYAQVVVEEASQKGVSLAAAKGLLLCPVQVVLGEPEKVVVA